MGKGCLIGCAVVSVLTLVLLAFVAAIGFFAFGATAPAVAAADEFLALLGEGQIEQAYHSASRSLQEEHDEASFNALVEQLQLDQFRSAWWSNREVKNSLGSVEGTITTRSGAEYPLTVGLIHEDGAWKVSSLSGSLAGPLDQTDDLPRPTEVELVELVRASLLDFNTSITSSDFGSFHTEISKLWQSQITPDELAGIFHQFVDAQIDIGGVADAEPVFSAPPSIDDEEMLHADGYFLIDSRQVKFSLIYTYEHPNWKLAGINISVNEFDAGVSDAEPSAVEDTSTPVDETGELNSSDATPE